jgi:hypothetical protein
VRPPTDTPKMTPAAFAGTDRTDDGVFSGLLRSELSPVPIKREGPRAPSFVAWEGVGTEASFRGRFPRFSIICTKMLEAMLIGVSARSLLL